ncbi:MAG: pilus assembly protein PilM [Candidatus Paceibacter sp.]|nr:pilus assembly protein PilM [Candidatus Paceibacter sp.]
MKTDNFFFKLFPPPDYLKMPALCLDISDRSLKYMEFAGGSGGISLKKYGLFPIPEGVIERGEIKQKEKLAEVLRPIQKKLKNRLVMASLPEEKAFLSRVKFPLMPEKEIRGSIELQLDECVPLSAAEAIFDFDVISRSDEEGHMDINIIAFSKTFVEQYRDVLRESGYIPAAFEMEAHAFARSVVPWGERGNVIVVDFGRTRATFAIVAEGKVQFATTVGVAGQDVENAIVSNLKVGKEDVEKIKREVGFYKTKNNEDVFNAMLPIISVIKDEIKKQIDYWVSHYDEHAKDGRKGRDKAKIQKVILCGGESTLAGLPEYLSYELKLKVELGNPWVNVCSFDDYIPEIERGDSLAYATVIGLALRQWQ